MGVFDTTMVDVAAKGAISAPPAEDGGKPPAEGGKEDNGAEARPATTDLISGILDKHGLTSAEELGEFIDNLTSLKGRIGDEDPEELLKAKQTLQTYHKEWAKQEREKIREKETPEETIARLEKELRDEQTRKTKNQAQT